MSGIAASRSLWAMASVADRVGRDAGAEKAMMKRVLQDAGGLTLG